MATDYISREAAIETAFDYRVDVIENEYDKGYQTAVVDIAKGLNALPAADVREVVRGKWIEENYGYAQCSVCHCDTNNLDSEGFPIGADEKFERAKFCPHCGADMRGEQCSPLRETEGETR